VIRGLAAPAELATRPGLRRAVVLEPRLTRSEAERRLVKLVRAARLPLPVTNTRLAGWEVDAFWPRHRVVVEVDGYAYHGNRAAFERDRRKDAALVAAGYRVVRITWRQLADEPHAVVALLARLLPP
jgi:very-short-patch-repair endonuclease